MKIHFGFWLGLSVVLISFVATSAERQKSSARKPAAKSSTVQMVTPTPVPEKKIEDWVPLYDLVSPGLQIKLENKLVSKPKWKTLIQQKRLAVGVVDLNGESPEFARVNGNVMMYAASLPKIAILFAVYSAFEDGSLQETPEIHEDLAAMIRVSNNASAAKMVNLVGLDKIESVLTDPKYGFYDETRGGGLWVGKAYSKEGKRHGDPLHNISHGATVTQTCRFYYLLANHLLISKARSEQMLADLKDPELHHKFVGVLDKLAPDADVYRKSGTWKNWHSDSVMVRGAKWRNYILVAMVEDADGANIIKDILPAVESILKRPQVFKHK